MLVVNNPVVLREQISQWRREGRAIAFVPTMGNLHQGHLTLVKEAHSHAEKVVVSIFVNPMQFDKVEDLANYPRTLEQDCAALEAAGVDMVFTPTPEIMYPQGLASQTLPGPERPGKLRLIALTVTCSGASEEPGPQLAQAPQEGCRMRAPTASKACM